MGDGGVGMGCDMGNTIIISLGAFVEGHQNLDVLLVPNEVVENYRSQSKEDVIFKQLIRQLEDQATVNDPLTRMSIQFNTLRSAGLFSDLGALLLELGRTTTTLRMGQAPADAVVNAGPAVYISTSGPNPIMVQVLQPRPGYVKGLSMRSSSSVNTTVAPAENSDYVQRLELQIAQQNEQIASPHSRYRLSEVLQQDHLYLPEEEGEQGEGQQYTPAPKQGALMLGAAHEHTSPFQILAVGGALARPSVSTRGGGRAGRGTAIHPRTKVGRTHVGSSSRAPIPDDNESETQAEAKAESSEDETGDDSGSGSNGGAGDDAPGPSSRKRTRIDSHA
ncbi:uncharacterized protein LOC114304165 [Camellia sinensis]|uniref:uncharacterized protein LOC114304165 n=1 Tax=Camellia sinensis TaxID=4442 RepID=UPI0010356723|nr:uncharacterized protein LOC114304165 [Camellia sinensis]